MSEDKLYRVKTKAGAHINEKIKEDGSRAAIQFDEENGLQGPVDLVEVDEQEYIKDTNIESEVKERSFGQVILEDALAPAIRDALTEVFTRAFEAGLDALGNWMSDTVIPAAKAKWSELLNKAHESLNARKEKKAKQKQITIEGSEKKTDPVVANPAKANIVVHTEEEVHQIINNMKFASLYIAAGIRELSNTVIVDEDIDPETILLMQGSSKDNVCSSFGN